MEVTNFRLKVADSDKRRFLATKLSVLTQVEVYGTEIIVMGTMPVTILQKMLTELTRQQALYDAYHSGMEKFIP
jgi:hypothetical protein